MPYENVGDGLSLILINVQVVRDWSLIMGRDGPTKWENHAPPPLKTGLNCLHPPPPPPHAPLLKWKPFVTPFNMAKTSSYSVKTTPKLLMPPPPSAWLKLISLPPPPPFFS